MKIKNLIIDIEEMYYTMNMSISQIAELTHVAPDVIENILSAYPENYDVSEEKNCA